jgi:hypothetical protein
VHLFVVLPRFTAITQYKQDLDIEPLYHGGEGRMVREDELQPNDDAIHYPTQDWLRLRNRCWSLLKDLVRERRLTDILFPHANLREFNAHLKISCALCLKVSSAGHSLSSTRAQLTFNQRPET